MPEMIVFYTLRDTQCLGSLADVAWLDPEDGSITPCASSNGLHGCDVNPGLSQLAKYVGNSTYAISMVLVMFLTGLGLGFVAFVISAIRLPKRLARYVDEPPEES